MPPIPAAHKKLEETKFFYGRLQEKNRGMGQGADPLEFEFYLSAFLSAGRSVIFIHEHVDGNYDFFERWKVSLISNGRQSDVDLMTQLGTERNKELHRTGTDVAIRMDGIPITEMIGKDRSHPAYQIQWFGPPDVPSLPRPEMKRPVYSFSGSGDEVIGAARRYTQLLEEFVSAYDSAHP